MLTNDALPIPKVEESTIIHDEFIKVRRDSLRYPNHHMEDHYTLITRTSAVAILATTESGEFILTEEYRHATGQFILSAPGGYIEENEDPLVAAERELLEETGYQARGLAFLGEAYPYPGISNQKIIYAFAECASPFQDPKLDPAELLRPVLKRPQEIHTMIANGCPVDGTLCTAFFFLKGMVNLNRPNQF